MSKRIDIMKKLKSTLAILFIGILVMSACKKNNDDDGNKPQAILIDTNLIVNKPWKLKSVYYEDNNGWQDFGPFIHPCEWDNLLYFESGGNAKVEEGALKCTTADPVFTKGGIWYIDRESKVLSLKNDEDVQNFQISDINDTQMVVFARVKSNPFEVDAKVTFIEDNY